MKTDWIALNSEISNISNISIILKNSDFFLINKKLKYD